MTLDLERSDALIQVLQENAIFNRSYALHRGVEIGVRNAENAEMLLRAFPKLQLFLVDPYAPYADVHEDFSIEKQQSIELRAHHKLEPYKERVCWIKNPSVEASQCLWSMRFDFCFIDGLHTYEGVIRDIHAWSRQVNPGGLIAGHDYDMSGVRQAVTEYFKKVTHVPYPADVWYIIQKD